MGLSHRASLYFSTSKISLFLSLPLSLVHLSICTVTTHILSVKLACCCDTGASIYLSICKCRSTLTHTHSEKLPFCVCVCVRYMYCCACLCLAWLCLHRWWYLVIISVCISSSILQPFWVGQVPPTTALHRFCSSRKLRQTHTAPLGEFKLLSAYFPALI